MHGGGPRTPHGTARVKQEATNHAEPLPSSDAARPYLAFRPPRTLQPEAVFPAVHCS
jgi:hypothetical protein